jgi:hypothetical protein
MRAVLPVLFSTTQLCPGGEIGRHKGFKIPRSKGHAGSSPAPGTISFMLYNIFSLNLIPTLKAI